MKILGNAAYLVGFLLILVFGMRFVMPKGPGNMLGIKIGKENKQNESDTKFSDIAGMEEVKNELIEIVDFLKDPEKYTRI
jgi:ATP-dependent zinc metalloprotease ftsH